VGLQRITPEPKHDAVANMGRQYGKWDVSKMWVCRGLHQNLIIRNPDSKC
jgi:hypothetical protein